MNHNHSPQDSERLESPLDAAVAAVLAEPIADASVQRVQQRARVLFRPAAAVRPNDMSRPRKSLSRMVGGGLIAVVALAALAIGTSLVVDRGAGSAFAQVVEKVKAANSVQFHMTSTVDGKTEMVNRVFLEDDRMRIELGDGLVQIANLAEKKLLMLDTGRKQVQTTPLDSDTAKLLSNPVEQIRQAKSDDAEAIGEEVLDGIRCSVFRLHNVHLLGASGDMLMWANPQSGLPVRFVINDPKLGKMQIRFDDFVWNEPLEPGLFSLNVPVGFQPAEIVSQPKPEQPTPDKATLDAPNVASDGILSRDRVPARIIWSTDGATVTALMREPEASPKTHYRQNELRQWDVATGKLRWSADVAGASAVAATVDGRLLAVSTGENVQLRDAATGAVIQKWETDLFPPALSFSPDGKSLALTRAEWRNGAEVAGGIEIRDVARGAIVRSIKDDRPTTFVAYSPDGKYIASSSNSGPVRLWDAATGELGRVFPGTKCAFSPDGRTIACASIDVSGDKQLLAKVDLYDLASAALVKSLVSERATQTSWLLSVAFSPKGRLLAAANWDGTVTVWDVASGERKLTNTVHTGGVHTARFSPDGLTLATGSEDKTLRLTKLPAGVQE
ncbi:MAG: hypothetical protein U0992_07230 [Planctomycetaceae bacterium]